jgi:GNAT superfamily N-acetyltransferase
MVTTPPSAAPTRPPNRDRTPHVTLGPGDLGQAGGVEIRRLEPGDEMVALEASRLFGGDGDIDPVAFLNRPETALMLADDGLGVAGWVYGHELVHPDGERTMLLYALDVAERARRRGVGTALVNAFVDHARAISCTEVWVLTDDTNAAGIATYQGAGGQRDAAPQVMFTWKIAEGRHS